MNKLNQAKKTLLINIGNDGTADGALVWQFLDECSDLGDHLDFIYRYQLQIDDAQLVSKYNQVMFVDASQQPLERGFSFYSCVDAPTLAFTNSSTQNPNCAMACWGTFWCPT